MPHAMPHASRRRYPPHEARHPWLTRLLNAYHISDTATRADLERETALRGAPPACRAGCNVCCTSQVIPVTAFEIMGIFWFVAEVLDEAVQAVVRANLRAHRPEDGQPVCPFLVEGSCAVYPVRPFICRQHHVFGEPCRLGENLREDRPRDVFNSAHDSARDMAWELFPLFGVAEDDIDWRFESGYMGGRSKDLHSLPLWNIITHMDAAARRKQADNAGTAAHT